MQIVKRHRDLLNQLNEAENEVIEAMNRARVTDGFLEILPQVLDEQAKLIIKVETIIANIQKTKQEEEIFLKDLEKNHGRKFSVNELIEELKEND